MLMKRNIVIIQSVEVVVIGEGKGGMQTLAMVMQLPKW